MTLLDTGPLVALLDRREQHHSWATARMHAIDRPLLACDAVLSEACFMLAKLPRARLQLRLWIQSGFLGPISLDAASAAHALVLMERYANVPMSFADACLVVLAGQGLGTRIFTLDRDFLIYRSGGARPLALLAPFAA